MEGPVPDRGSPGTWSEPTTSRRSGAFRCSAALVH